MVLPAEVHRQLKFDAAAKNSTVSAVIRLAIKDYLELKPANVTPGAGQRMLKVR